MTTKTTTQTKPTGGGKGVQTTVRPAEIKKLNAAPAVDPELLRMMREEAGRGVSTSAEDNIVPLLYLLQKMSPQLDRNNREKFIKNAKDGDIWFRGTQTVIDGEGKGIEVIPCFFSKCWIQWKPNRGGFVAKHAARPEAAELREEETQSGGTRNVWRIPNGDSVQETREHVVIVTSLSRPMGVVIPMTSTNHTASREWMGLMKDATVPGTDVPAPSYAYKYRLRTVPRKNDQGSWYMWRAEHAGEEDGAAVPLPVADISMFKMAKKLNADFSSGALRADSPDEGIDETAATTDDM